VLIYGTNSKLLGAPACAAQGHRFTARFAFCANLVSANTRDPRAAQGVSHLDGCYHWVDNAATFAVVDHDARCFDGVTDLNTSLRRCAGGHATLAVIQG